MSGDLRADGGGQLALLDATIFFAVAMLLSSALIGQVARSTPGELAGGDLAVDPAETLEVVMAASIGRGLDISIGPTIRIASDESVSECLRAEIHALMSGADIGAFDGLNEAVARVLTAVSGPCVKARLIVFPQGNSVQEPLLAIPAPSRSSGFAYASAMDLPCSMELICTVVLVLEPAPSSEFVQV